jgi:MFS family permease
MLQTPSSIETKQSWRVAVAALVTLMVGFGAAWITPVALKEIAREAGDVRSVPSTAAALVWLCAGAGGILMSRLAVRFGTRWTVITGSFMAAAGLAVSTLGPTWPLWIGHGLFLGLLGLGGINAPLYTYVSHWFDRRRGTALALISSGTYLAGAVWPPLFERMIASYGWRQTMLIYGIAQFAVVLPMATLVFRPAPDLSSAAGGGSAAAPQRQVSGLSPNVVFAVICAAAILCCIPMAMPQQHLVAFCTDLGLTRSFGALMLTVLLGTAFVTRQIWGAISDRIGGLMTVCIGAAWQAASMVALLLVSDEVGLILVTAAFGLGFSGIIPAYVLAMRELYPAREAYWRIPTVLMFTAIGMALGGSVAGMLYDYFGYYLPAFAFGAAASLLNAVIIGYLVLRSRGGGQTRLATA